MEIKIYKEQTETSRGVLSKSVVRSYSLKIVLDLSKEEASLFSKYDFLDTYYPLTQIEGLHGRNRVSLKELQNGVTWVYEGFVPKYFFDIIDTIKTLAETHVENALIRETWNGEDVIEINYDIPT